MVDLKARELKKLKKSRKKIAEVNTYIFTGCR
jgi:hypothetical protein